MRSAAVITVSDSCSRGERVDRSGPATAELLRQNGYEVLREQIVPDEQAAIEAAMNQLCRQARLIVTTGGTGIAVRDVTPEATRAVCQRLIDGIPERIRAAGVKSTPLAILSRGLCGVSGQSLILNLPGSPEAATESLLAVLDVLPHALDLLAGQTAHRE
jgi:molybdenum cofactor synthesis domain-containing protein